MIVKINLKKQLLKHNLRLSDVEKRIGLSYQQLWNINQGKTTKVSFDTLAQLLTIFKCTPNDLFTISYF